MKSNSIRYKKNSAFLVGQHILWCSYWKPMLLTLILESFYSGSRVFLDCNGKEIIINN